MLGDDIAQALPELRAQAESMMIDTVEIIRPGGTATDPTTGAVTTTGPIMYGPTISPFYGKARWKAPRTVASTDEVGTAQITSTAGELHLPVGIYQPQPGDVATCADCPLNPGQVGAKARLGSRFGGTHVTQYRVPFEEV